MESQGSSLGKNQNGHGAPLGGTPEGGKNESATTISAGGLVTAAVGMAASRSVVHNAKGRT